MSSIKAKALGASLEEKQWLLVRYAHSIVRPLGAVGILFGVAALAGYFGSVESLYRPFTGGPATNPLTAVCILFIGISLHLSGQTRRDKWIQVGAAFLVMAMTSVRMVDVVAGQHFAELMTPFQDIVTRELQQGKNNSMGLNSAILFFCIAAALAAYGLGKRSLSQIMAFATVAIPMVSFTGYAYKLESFYGQMSILTTTAGLGLAVATLAMTAHIGGLKAILSPYLGGRIARLQTVAGYVFPTALGFLVIKSLTSSDGSLFGLFVVAISWFVILMVSVSAIYQETIDSERRESERLLAKAALNDPLTGVSNRRKFLDFGRLEMQRVQRNGGQFWLLVLDIDFFKKINDNAGHDMGDRVLVKFAETLRESVRSVDLVSRIGGEEFAILLVDATKQGAGRVAETIRQNVEQTVIDGWTEIHGPVTVSIGCATNEGYFTFEEIIKSADEALYQAKNSGRNRVVFAEPCYQSAQADVDAKGRASLEV